MPSPSYISKKKEHCPFRLSINISAADTNSDFVNILLV